MSRFKFSFICVWLLAYIPVTLSAQSVVYMNVAGWNYHRVGQDGWMKVWTILDVNGICYSSVDFAGTTLSVRPDQAALTRKLLKKLIAKEKLPIYVLEEGEKYPHAGFKF